MKKWNFFLRQPLHLVLLLLLCGGLWLAGLIPGFRISHSWNITVGTVVVVSVVIGAELELDGNGTLITIGSNEAIAVAMEAIDASDSAATAVASRRIQVLIL